MLNDLYCDLEEKQKYSILIINLNFMNIYQKN